MEDERCLMSEGRPRGVSPEAGSEVVRSQFFSQSTEPILSFGRLKLWVNGICLKKLPEADYVQILVNSRAKTLALRPSREDVRDALPWCSSCGGRRKPRQLSCPLFFAKIYALMRWESDCRYRLTGRHLCENQEHLLAFDLQSAEAFLYRGDVTRRYMPRFPADWRDQFGTPAAEHRMEPLVHVFQEYVVFELEAPALRPDGSDIQEGKGESGIWQSPTSENCTP